LKAETLQSTFRIPGKIHATLSQFEEDAVANRAGDAKPREEKSRRVIEFSLSLFFVMSMRFPRF
jgi:hypothetical protein